MSLNLAVSRLCLDFNVELILIFDLIFDVDFIDNSEKFLLKVFFLIFNCEFFEFCF